MSNNEKKNDDELYEHHNIKVNKYQSLLRIDKFLIDKIRLIKILFLKIENLLIIFAFYYF